MKQCDLTPTRRGITKGMVPGCPCSLHVPYMLAACETKESGKQWFGKELTGVDDA